MTQPREPAVPAPVRLDAGVASHQLHMEDRTLVSLRMQLFGVMDGVGGTGGGAEVAALAVDAVHDFVAQSGAHPTTVRQAQSLLAGALARADDRIAQHNQQSGAEFQSSATTAAIVLLFQPSGIGRPSLVAVAATVGDSRIMLLRDGRLFTLTLDHSMFADGDVGEAYERQSRLDAARSLYDLEDPVDRAAFTHRHLISSALDGSGHPNARFYAFRLASGDRLIIESDGIHDNLSTSDLTQLVTRSSTPQEVAAAVTESAWRRSMQDVEQEPRAKPDDMSIIVIDVPPHLLDDQPPV